MDKYRKQLEGILARAAEVNDELDEFAELDELDDEQEVRYAELMTEGAALADEEPEVRSRIEAHDAIRSLANRENVEVVAGTRTAPGQIKQTDDPYNIDEVRINVGQTGATELRGRALKAVATESDYSLNDAGKERLSYLLERKDDKAGTIAKLVLGTGSDAYRQAFAKAISGAGHMMSDLERAAMVRAASLTDSAGGYAVPFPIDPSLILSNEGSANPFRQISRVETITTDSWQGISAGAISASWDGATAEVSDDTPTWAQPQVNVEKAQAFIPYNIEIGEDYNGFAEDVFAAIVAGKDELEATAFVTGSGTDTPQGIVTALTGGSYITTSASTDTFVAADVYSTFQELAPKHRSKAVWTMNLNVLNLIRQMGTTAFHTQLAEFGDGNPPNLLGRPVYEASAFDGALTGSADNYFAVVGNFGENYLIADRVGLSVEHIPHLFATGNNRPSGSRGIYAYWRTGADSINDTGFQMLNVT